MWKKCNIILMVFFMGSQKKPTFLGREVGWGKRDVTLCSQIRTGVLEEYRASVVRIEFLSRYGGSMFLTNVSTCLPYCMVS